MDKNQNQKIVIFKADVVHAVHCVRLSRPQLVPTLQEYSLIYRSRTKTKTNIKTTTRTRETRGCPLYKVCCITKQDKDKGRGKDKNEDKDKKKLVPALQEYSLICRSVAS